MGVWVVLLRGINVGGHGKLPMAQLREILANLGGEAVQTYIQSGNVVLRHASRSAAVLQDSIAEAIESAAGFRPQVLALSKSAFCKAAASQPFPGAQETNEGRALHLFFLSAKPSAKSLKTLLAGSSASEAGALIGTTFYLHSPKGISGSKLAPKVERQLGVAATARNWRTVNQLLGMLDEL